MLHGRASADFALANPEPEVSYEAVGHVRPDAIFASGRSDYPNQVNNVLAFPSIFRGRSMCVRRASTKR